MKEDLMYELLVNVEISKISFILLKFIIIVIVLIIIHSGTAISTHFNEGPIIYKCVPYSWYSAFLLVFMFSYCIYISLFANLTKPKIIYFYF